jgi:hypothetical protein
LQGACGDLDEGVFWNKSQRSRHAYLSVKAPEKLRSSAIGSLENSGTADPALRIRVGCPHSIFSFVAINSIAQVRQSGCTFALQRVRSTLWRLVSPRGGHRQLQRHRRRSLRR